jgi:AbrB family looped-hinge helix DNA binding protein
VVIFLAGAEKRIVEVDRQGRMVLPWRLRERLGVKKGGSVSIKLEDSSRVVIEPKASESVEERVECWLKLARKSKAKLAQESNKASPKWMSEGYARRKLGLR